MNFLTFYIIGGTFLFVFIILSLVGKSINGIWWWTEIYFKEKGLRSTAIIVDSVRTNTNMMQGRSPMYKYTVVLDVKDPNTGTIFRVMKSYLDTMFSYLGEKGYEVPVLIHPKNKNLIIIDRTEINRRKKAKQKAKENMDFDRLNNLMN